MKFGTNDCSEIEVEPLKPICSFPDIDGTTPLALDVPVPAFLHPMPPNECACFDFTSTESETKVVDDCETPGRTPKCSVTIRQSGDDCCAGAYVVEPHVEIPCIPFDLKDARVSVHTKSGGGDVDGGAELSIESECCALTPVLDLTLPQCVKPYENPPDVQIEYLDHGVKRSHKLVSIKNDAENCTFYPTVSPLDLPCPFKDWSLEGESSLSNLGGSIKWNFSYKDCVPSGSVTVTPMTISIPGGPCLAAGSLSLKTQHTDCDGNVVDGPPTTIPLKVGSSGGCPKYTTDGTVTIDLGQICSGEDPGPGSAGFANGGDGNIVAGGGGAGGAGGDPGSNYLMLDGASNDYFTTWYGGGYGDHKLNDTYKTTYCRGPEMRNGQASPLDGETSEDLRNVPIESVGSIFVEPTETDDAKRVEGLLWTSGRITDEEEPAAAAAAESPASGSEPEPHEVWNWEATANLNIVWPTGIQWHKTGLALTLTEFEYTASGVLSFVEEKGEAVIVSPRPALTKAATIAGASVNAGLNASGLKVLAEPGSHEYDRMDHGLRVDTGDGLRIYGTDPDRTGSDEEYKSEHQGKLEVMCGKGLHIRDKDVGGKPTYRECLVDKSGALTLSTLEHDIDFTPSALETYSIPQGQLMINDKAAFDDCMLGIDDYSSIILNRFDRHEDMAVPITMACVDFENIWFPTEDGNGYMIDENGIYEKFESYANSLQTITYDITDLIHKWEEQGTTEEDIKRIQLARLFLDVVNNGLYLKNVMYDLFLIAATLRVTAFHIAKSGIITNTDAEAWSSDLVTRFSDASSNPKEDRTVSPIPSGEVE